MCKLFSTEFTKHIKKEGGGYYQTLLNQSQYIKLSQTHIYFRQTCMTTSDQHWFSSLEYLLLKDKCFLHIWKEFYLIWTWQNSGQNLLIWSALINAYDIYSYWVSQTTIYKTSTLCNLNHWMLLTNVKKHTTAFLPISIIGEGLLNIKPGQSLKRTTFGLAKKYF